MNSARRKTDPAELTDLHRRIVVAHVKGLKGLAAAEDAGVTYKNPETAHASISRILSQPAAKAYADQLRAGQAVPFKLPEPRRRFKVTSSTVTLTVYPWTRMPDGKACWRFGWKDGNRWCYITKTTREEARTAAEAKAAELARGDVDLNALPPDRKSFLAAIHAAVAGDDETEVLAFVATLRRPEEPTRPGTDRMP